VKRVSRNKWKCLSRLQQHPSSRYGVAGALKPRNTENASTDGMEQLTSPGITVLSSTVYAETKYLVAVSLIKQNMRRNSSPSCNSIVVRCLPYEIY